MRKTIQKGDLDDLSVKDEELTQRSEDDVPLNSANKNMDLLMPVGVDRRKQNSSVIIKDFDPRNLSAHVPDNRTEKSQIEDLGNKSRLDKSRVSRKNRYQDGKDDDFDDISQMPDKKKTA